MVFVFAFMYGGVQATQGMHSTMLMTDLAKKKSASFARTLLVVLKA